MAPAATPKIPPYYRLESREDSFPPFLPKAKGKKKPIPKPGYWPHPETFGATPKTLSEAGFFFVDQNDPNASTEIPDEVECFLCGQTLGGWEADDIPHAQHAERIRKKPCPWAISVCAVREEQVGDGWSFAAPERLPSSAKMVQARLETFGKYWSHKKEAGLTAKDMAVAGFVFTPTADQADMVTCPYCLSAYDSWSAPDDPYNLHKQKNPRCPVFSGQKFLVRQVEEESVEEDPLAASTAKTALRKTTNRKPSAAQGTIQRAPPRQVAEEPPSTSTKKPRQTRATITQKQDPIAEDSEPEEDLQPPPPPPKKKAVRAKSSVAPNALAKSTRGKKAPPIEEDEEVEANDNVSDFGAGPGLSAPTRNRSQQLQADTLSRHPGKLRPEGVGQARSRSQQISGSSTRNRHPSKQSVVPDMEEEDEDMPPPPMARSTRTRAPPPELDDLEEAQPEPEPQPVKKAKPKAKPTKAKKTELLDLPPVAVDVEVPTKGADAPRPPAARRQTTRGKQTPPDDAIEADEREVEAPPVVKAPKTKAARTKQSKEEPVVDDAMETSEADAEPVQEAVAKAKKKPARKTAAKGKKAAPKGKAKARSASHDSEMDIAPPPEPAPPEPSSDSEQATEAMLTEPDSDSASASASAGPSDVDDYPPEPERANLPLMDSSIINAATGPTIPKSLGSQSLQQSTTPRALLKKLPVLKSNAAPPTPPHKQTTPRPAPAQTRTPSPKRPQRLHATPAALAAVTSDNIVTFTAEERAMTLEQFVTHKMDQQFRLTKEECERSLAEFDATVDSTRRQLERL